MPKVERQVDVEVNGKRFDVRLWVPDIAPTVVAGGARRWPASRPVAAAGGGGGSGSGDVTVPMQGTIVKVLVEVGRPSRSARPSWCSRP